MTTGFTDTSALLGLKSLWVESLGDPGICVAVLDGPVDQSHPCFDGVNLTRLPTLVSGVADRGSASQHGTHVASIIFGQHDSPVLGIAPNCRGLIVPVFADGRGGGLAPCSQIDLARAITQAVEQGANVINISGGQLAASAESDKLLENAVRLCQENNVLIVAAVGNDGCNCLHVPAALESVLAVGAMDAQGNPIEFSNWGEAYQNQGILALGENILGAIPGGGTATKTGTSFATPIVSGIVALLLSIQLQRGEKPDPHAIRDAILQSALPCNQPKGLDSRRCLVGTLNISGAYTLITKGEIKQVSNEKLEEVMLQPNEADNSNEQLQPSEAIEFSLEQSVPQSSGIGVQAAEAKTSTSVPTAMSMGGNPMMVTPSKAAASSVTPSGADGGCSCGGGGPMQLVYALGELGYDFGTQARRDSIQQAMNLTRPPLQQELLYYFSGEDVEGNPFRNDPHPWDAQSIIWTLNLDATPIYAIAPAGPYASLTYDRLRQFLADQNVERVSIPGYIGGSVRLMSGQVVPVIIPQVRGMFSWTVPALIDSLMQATPTAARENVTGKLREYLERTYYDYRNLGITPQERAINFSATNAFQVATVMADAATGDLGLDSITVKKSPICRPDSDCYDVKLQFFNLEDNRRSGKVYRFTIDVSDVIPVTIGAVRSWSVAS
jgi:cyanobactin maturation PatA/PatG family protease